jgi:hypothetical protein
MKKINFSTLFILVLPVLLTACGNPANNTAQQAKAHSAQVEPYKPGLGEFMMGIQVHHAKIWFAGKNQNWPLADFEVGEIKETLEDVKKYCTDRPEIKSLPILYPALDSVNAAIKTKDPARFKKSFVFLTNTCNNCHQTTHHEFNVIKIPDTPPYTNQEFKVR